MVSRPDIPYPNVFSLTQSRARYGGGRGTGTVNGNGAKTKEDVIRFDCG